VRTDPYPDLGQPLLRFPTSLRTTGTPFEQAAKSRPLLTHGGVNQSPEPSLGDQTFREQVAEEFQRITR
jgi:hypothetical protein